MKFSFKKIKHIYLIYSIIRAVILIVVSVLVFFLYNRYVLLDKYINIIGKEMVHFVEYKTFSDNLELKNFLREEKLYEKRDSFINLLKVSQNDIISIHEDNKVDDIHFRENVETLLSDYELLVRQNELLFKYIINIGDLNTGLYNKMKKAEQTFLLKLEGFDSQGIVSAKFKLLDHSLELLVENKSILLLNEVQKQIKDISSDIDSRVNFPNNYSKIRVQDSYLYFQTSFYELAKQISAIGFGNEIGLLAELNLNYSRIEKRLDKLLIIIKNRKEILIRYVFIVISALILFSIVFSMFLSRFLGVEIRKIFDGLKHYISILKKGEFPKLEKNKFVQESHELFDLFDEYQNQIVVSKEILQSLIENKKEENLKYDEQSLILKSELLKVEDVISTLKKKLNDEISKSKNIFWVNKGIGQITDILRSNYDNSVLQSDELITSLVKFLDSPIGALYSVDNKVITMRASFAYGEKKRIKKQLIFGEGIVGTAAAERRTILINAIPNDYFDIISGFGKAKPRNILVCPIKLNDEVYGVIELASFSQFSEKEIEFIEEVSKTIAYSFAISKIANENLVKIDNMNIEISQLKNENATLLNDYDELNLTYKQINDEFNDNKLVMKSIDDVAMIADVYIDGSVFNYNKSFDEFFKSIGINSFSYNFKEYLAEINKSPNFDIELIWKNLKLGVKHLGINNVKIFDVSYSFYNIFLPISYDDDKISEIKIVMFNLTEQKT